MSAPFRLVIQVLRGEAAADYGGGEGDGEGELQGAQGAQGGAEGLGVADDDLVTAGDLVDVN